MNIIVILTAGLVLINLLKLNKIMATVKQLNEKVDALQMALDAEQAQIAQVISDLEALNAQLAEISGTEEERVAVAGKLDSIIADLKSTIADPEPEPDEPAPDEPVEDEEDNV